MSWIIPSFNTTIPPPRSCHTTTPLGDGTKLFIFGGDDGKRALLNDSYILNTDGTKYGLF
jgi:hypothetical protein